jgi:hypothetical protein
MHIYIFIPESNIFMHLYTVFISGSHIFTRIFIHPWITYIYAYIFSPGSLIFMYIYSCKVHIYRRHNYDQTIDFTCFLWYLEKAVTLTPLSSYTGLGRVRCFAETEETTGSPNCHIQGSSGVAQNDNRGTIVFNLKIDVDEKFGELNVL